VTSIISLFGLGLVFFLMFDGVLGVFKAEEMVRSYLEAYYKIMIFVYPIMMLNTCFGMFIRGAGKPEAYMLVTIFSIVLNVVLDYVFIAQLGFGIRGVAIASMISVLLATGLMVLYFLKKSEVFKFGTFTFSRPVFRETILNGSSELIGQLSMCITMFVFNWMILKTVGTTGLAAFTVVGYGSYVFSMIIIGFGQGASPIISFGFGAGDLELCRKVRRLTNRYVLGVGIVILFTMNFAGAWYSNIFVKNSEVEALVVSGLMIFTLSFLFSGINVITSFYFTSIGYAKESAIISSARGLIILIIAILVLPSLFGMTGVWMVAPVTEFLTLLICLGMIKKQDKKLSGSVMFSS